MDVPHEGNAQVERERHVELARDESEGARRPVGDHAPLDGVDVGMPFAPIVRVAYELDRLVALELDELERPRADGLGAHVGCRHMTWVDGGVAGGEE